MTRRKLNIEPLDLDKASLVIDALSPIIFDIPGVRGEGATRDPIPIKKVGLQADDIVKADVHVDRLTRVDLDGVRGYSLGGMLAIAIAEIKNLRARVAQLESGT